MNRRSSVPIERVDVSVYRIPTDAPESDGTLAWDHTTVVVAEPYAGGKKGIGYTYSHTATAKLIEETLVGCVVGHDALAPTSACRSMMSAVRNLGNRGIAAMAISAVDASLWDLKAKLLNVPLVSLLGAVRDGVAAYGSGGFTSYSVGELCTQLAGWAAAGMTMVKMKVGRDPASDISRVRAARESIGDRVQLFVDANGAYGLEQAAVMAGAFRELGVTWFEEPVPSDDLNGLRRIRGRKPTGMEIAVGEYGYEIGYYDRILAAGAADVIQADVTRCDGITGMLCVSALCMAARAPLSAHCAPSQHLHLACACEPMRHVEYFHDHARIEAMLFDGAATPKGGMLRPDLSRAGMGIELKRHEAERWRV